MDERDVEYWADEDAVDLQHTDMDEAIEELLNYLHYDWPLEDETLVICGYRMVKVEPLAWSPLEAMLENLDDQYAGFDLHTTASKEMLQAEKDFVDKIMSAYVPTRAEEVCRRRINVKAWMKEHEPEWYEEYCEKERKRDRV